MEDYSSEDDWEQRFEVKVKEEEEEEDDEGNKRDWASLPSELLSQMLTSLYLDDVKRFRRVCKNWDSTEDLKQHCPLTHPTVPSQWLVHKDTYHGTICKFFHPFYTDRYCIDIPELASAVLLHSHNGWLLMALGEKTLFFINPFTKARVNLPEPFSHLDWKNAIFSHDPTSPNCKVIGITSMTDSWCRVYTTSRGDSAWKDSQPEHYVPMFHSDCHPVFHNDKIYCLGIDGGNMGVLDPTNDEWTAHKLSNEPPEELTYESYLVECDGQLIAVFLSYMGTNISILKLDEKRMEWQKVDSLGDFMLFISLPTSFAIKKDIDGMENKIYFPRLYGDYIVFYCLATRSYRTFGNRFTQKHLFGTREQLNSSWTQPSAVPISGPEQLEWFLNGDLETPANPK